MVIDETHCLNGAQWCPSQHCDALRPAIGSTEGFQSDFLAELIVVHCISLPEGEFGTGLPSQLFTGELDCDRHPSFADLDGLRVAPHVFIDRNAQIEQLYVNKEFEIELIPRVGNHRIVVGDATDIKTKLDKLKVFYDKGLNKTGWNEYSVINLKFANQVVCKKRN